MKIHLCDFFDNNGEVLVLDKKGYRKFMRERFPAKPKSKSVVRYGASDRVAMLQRH